LAVKPSLRRRFSYAFFDVVSFVCHPESMFKHLIQDRKEVVPVPETNTPVDKSQIGSVSVAVFINDGKRGPYHTLTLQKTYRDDKDELQHMSVSLKPQEAAAALIALRQELDYVAKTNAKIPAKEAVPAAA
jgi:hypothetical protein